MKAEHPSYAEELHNFMTLRHADMVREQLDIVIPALWSKKPTGPTENTHFGEIDTPFFRQRTICLTRGVSSKLTSLIVRKPKEKSLPKNMLRYILPELQDPPGRTNGGKYFVLPSGFIIPAPEGTEPVQQILLPDALYLYGFLLGVQQTLEELN